MRGKKARQIRKTFNVKHVRLSRPRIVIDRAEKGADHASKITGAEEVFEREVWPRLGEKASL
jgi:hypothetical protein